MLDERIRTTLSLLIATQQDGGWPIDGRQGTVANNALAHWSLVLADKAGFDVPRDVLDSALERLRGSAGGDQESDLETKAIVLHALAIGGQGDFALANHLLRDRKLLSPLARAYLALALLQMDRKETAAEVLRVGDRYFRPTWNTVPSLTGGQPKGERHRPDGQPETRGPGADGPGLAGPRPGVAAGQGPDRNDSEPTHGPPLDAGKSDGAGRSGR